MPNPKTKEYDPNSPVTYRVIEELVTKYARESLVHLPDTVIECLQDLHADHVILTVNTAGTDKSNENKLTQLLVNYQKRLFKKLKQIYPKITFTFKHGTFKKINKDRAREILNQLHRSSSTFSWGVVIERCIISVEIEKVFHLQQLINHFVNGVYDLYCSMPLIKSTSRYDGINIFNMNKGFQIIFQDEISPIITQKTDLTDEIERKSLYVNKHIGLSADKDLSIDSILNDLPENKPTIEKIKSYISLCRDLVETLTKHRDTLKSSLMKTQGFYHYIIQPIMQVGKILTEEEIHTLWEKELDSLCFSSPEFRQDIRCVLQLSVEIGMMIEKIEVQLKEAIENISIAQKILDDITQRLQAAHSMDKMLINEDRSKQQTMEPQQKPQQPTHTPYFFSSEESDRTQAYTKEAKEHAKLLLSEKQRKADAHSKRHNRN